MNGHRAKGHGLPRLILLRQRRIQPRIHGVLDRLDQLLDLDESQTIVQDQLLPAALQQRVLMQGNATASVLGPDERHVRRIAATSGQRQVWISLPPVWKARPSW